MLTKLLPDQIAKFWPVIKYAIEESLPPVVGGSLDRMNNILTALLCDRAQCWMSYTKSDGRNKFKGVVITKIAYDDISDTKSLLIYCLYGYEKTNKGTWLSALKSLVKYAISRGCTSIIGYSEVSSIIKLVEGLGGNTNYRFIRVPLF